MDRLLRLYGKELEVSEEAAVAVNDTNKRRNNMNYRWLWKNGCYNGTFQRGSGVAAAGRAIQQISWHALAGGGTPPASVPSSPVYVPPLSAQHDASGATKQNRTRQMQNQIVLHTKVR